MSSTWLDTATPKPLAEVPSLARPSLTAGTVVFDSVARYASTLPSRLDGRVRRRRGACDGLSRRGGVARKGRLGPRASPGSRRCSAEAGRSAPRALACRAVRRAWIPGPSPAARGPARSPGRRPGPARWRRRPRPGTRSPTQPLFRWRRWFGEEVRERRAREPSSSTLPMEVENLTSWVLALAVIPAASDRASDSVATSSFAWPSADFARSALPRASEDACARAAKASRASAMLACASSIWASAPSFDAAAFAFALPSSSSSTVATVELTVATNVSLMVVSSVLARRCR